MNDYCKNKENIPCDYLKIKGKRVHCDWFDRYLIYNNEKEIERCTPCTSLPKYKQIDRL